MWFCGGPIFANDASPRTALSLLYTALERRYRDASPTKLPGSSRNNTKGSSCCYIRRLAE
jgi:hypothetical protein